MKRGATREDIAEALGVAVAVNAGAAMVYSAPVLDAVDAHGGGIETAATYNASSFLLAKT